MKTQPSSQSLDPRPTSSTPAKFHPLDGDVPGVDLKIAEHEDAAHEKRNWVRLTFDCNNHCVFCLDTLAHDGNMRDPEEVKEQILDGRRKGATRLILSGGEPTMHPRFVDFIRLGKLAGYSKIQTVTNGRMFAYGPFLKRCLDAGLGEITFSLHGPNAKIHDALVGVKGAFVQEVAGLKAALADGRPIVNVDVVINRANVKHLPTMLQTFYDYGVREFDLLQVIPFGNAFKEGRDILFYDLAEMRPYLVEAFEWSRRPDVHIWLNRFPPPHLDGFEHLIQDPYKLNDEVRGRKEEFGRFLDEGIDLDCRDPARCRYCYLERLCDTLYDVRDLVARQAFTAARVDTEWEAKQEPVFGGDPASQRRSEREREALETARSKGLPLPIFAGPPRNHPLLHPFPSVEERVAAAGVKTLLLRAPHLPAALAALERYPAVESVTLDLDDVDGLREALDSDGRVSGRQLLEVVARSPEQAEALLALPFSFDVVVELSRATAPWLLGLGQPSTRLVLKQPTYERLTESAANDIDLRDFFGTLSRSLPTGGLPRTEGIPACVTGQAPRTRADVLDTAMMTPEGRLEIFRYAKRYILEHYLTKSVRCGGCVHDATCEGMHVNYVRAHGFAFMQPVEGVETADESGSEAG